jgi:glyoxylase-like metal-dependent hydrolase (beta-lactamase superfamily II)/rhodanese-related sulfurtransferase
MFIKQIYTGCLAQAAYYVESEGQAMIIDPLRDPAPYIDLAKERNTKIKYIFETHFHADFVSGPLDLSKKTGAVIVYGPGAKPGYQSLTGFDGEIFHLGAIKIKLLHTPGHTTESCCFLIYDETGKPYCIFTGDTLFVGDVGRPDLMSGNLSKEELAGMLYNSIQKKIKTLPDHVIMYPGHGAGSACGKNIGKETVSTIGEQRKTNYALQNITKDEFIQATVTGLPVPPAYFFKNAEINIKGTESHDAVVKSALKALSVEQFKAAVTGGATILDTRPADQFAEGFIAGSINIGLKGDFAVWAGTLLNFNTALVVVAEPGTERETILRLARIGYDNVLGFLEGGFSSWIKTSENCATIPSISLEEFNTVKIGHFSLLDVRNEKEVQEYSFGGSIYIPLNILKTKMDSLDRNQTVLVYCAGGYRSMMAASLLKRYGFQSVFNLKGGINAYKVASEMKKSA